jgi:predicted RNase H-related nuclease YkuK (DUF458 family)
MCEILLKLALNTNQSIHNFLKRERNSYLIVVTTAINKMKNKTKNTTLSERFQNSIEM